MTRTKRRLLSASNLPGLDGVRLRRVALASTAVALWVATLAGCQAATPSGAPGASGDLPVSADSSAEPPGSAASSHGATLRPVDSPSNPCLGGDVPGLGEARAAIENANLADAATIDEVDAIRFTDAGIAAAGVALASGVTGDARWAATWIAASMGCLEPLEPLLADDDATVRALAAAAFVAAGRPEGATALDALIGETALLRGSEPPISVGEFATVTLERYAAR